MFRAHGLLPISGVLVAVLLFVNLEVSMARDTTVTFFSEVNGLLVDPNGTPQRGIRIERSWNRSPEDEPTVDETVTSPSGTFSFPAATGRRTLAERLPGTPVIRQEITAFAPDGPVTLWKAVKTNLDPEGELNGRPLNLECRIGVEPGGDGPVWGTCRESTISIASTTTGEDEELELTWQWPAGRAVEVRLLVRIESVHRARRGFFGIRNSPSLAGSMPDPYDIIGIVVDGPHAFQNSTVELRVPGAETVGLEVGRLAVLGLLSNGLICVCIAPGVDGCKVESR
jgi:hypothetical protein